MGLLYLWYLLVGVNDLSNWNHGIRNLLIGVICTFLVQIIIQENMLYRMWYPGLITLYLWMGSFSYILAHSDLEGWGVRVEALNNDILTLLPVFILITLLEYFGGTRRKNKVFFYIVNMCLIGWFSFNAFVYIIYYLIFGAGITSTDMISVLLTNSRESLEFIQSHIGIGCFTGAILLFLIYMFGMGVLVVKGSKFDLTPELNTTKYMQMLQGLFVFITAIAIYHGISRIFPIYPYQVAHSYVIGAQEAMKFHQSNVEQIHLASVKPQKLEGSIIIIIGESSNRDHMKAFNLSYPADTTPWLTSHVNDPCFYLQENTYASFPATEKSLSMLLTNLNQYNGKTRNEMITLTDVANQIGYETWFISNQTPAPGNMALALSSGASQHNVVTKSPGKSDMQILDELKRIPKFGTYFILIHLEGSHDRYRDRIPPNFTGISVVGNSQKINDYDTTIKYTDDVLKAIYQYARENLNLQVMIYSSDHGEDMEAFHSDSYFTWDMVRTPFFTYLSPEYMQKYPDVAKAFRNNANRAFTNDLVFDTVCGVMQGQNNQYEAKYDLSSPHYELDRDLATTKYGKIALSTESVR